MRYEGEHSVIYGKSSGSSTGMVMALEWLKTTEEMGPNTMDPGELSRLGCRKGQGGGTGLPRYMAQRGRRYTLLSTQTDA